MMKTRQANNVIDNRGVVYAKNEIELPWSEQVQSVMKTRQDNDVINHTSVVYTKNKIKLSWPVRLGPICEANQIGQWCDW